MPTPSAPGVIRAQATFQGKSGLSEDRYVMTFHFRTPLAGNATGPDGAQELHHDEAAEKVREFFLDAPPDYSSGLVFLMGSPVYRGTAGLVVKTYHLGDPEPREPHVYEYDTLGTNPDAALPSEVAICLSFSGNRAALPRERGRVYFGPLHSGVQGIDAVGRPHIPGDKRALFVGAMARMAGGSDSEPARWVVYSPTNNNSVLVRQGYVDDAFDTQRRRGEAPVNRTSWTLPA